MSLFPLYRYGRNKKKLKHIRKKRVGKNEIEQLKSEKIHQQKVHCCKNCNVFPDSNAKLINIGKTNCHYQQNGNPTFGVPFHWKLSKEQTSWSSTQINGVLDIFKSFYFLALFSPFSC